MTTAAGSASYAAFFEVAALSSGLTVSSIVGSRFALRCVRSGSHLNLSGLAASLLAVFYCIYGLTYWLNGIAEFDCTALAVVMSGCLSMSNALTFIHLFILSNSLYQSSPRWKQFRWLGLVLTAFNWGTLVVDALMVTAEEDMGGIDGPRCVPHFDSVAFRLKWSAQLGTKMFQAVAFLLSLQLQPAGASRLRLLLGSGRASADYERGFHFPITTKVDRGILAVVVSLLITTVTAGLAFAKARGALHEMPIFAVEAMDNAVNLTAIFYAVHAPVPSKHLPKRRLPLKNSQRLDLASANKRYRSMSTVGGSGGGGGSGTSNNSGRIRSGRVGSRLRGFGGGGGIGGPGYGNSVSGGSGSGIGSGRAFRYSHGSEATSSTLPSPLQPHTGPIKRLPPVLDMSPEMRSPSSGNFSIGSSSPGGSAVAAKGRGRGTGRWAGKQGSWRHQAGAVGPLFFTRDKRGQPQAEKSVSPGADMVDARHDSEQRKLADDDTTDSDETKASSSGPAEFAALTRALDAGPPRDLSSQQPLPSGQTPGETVGVEGGRGAGVTLAQNISTARYPQNPAEDSSNCLCNTLPPAGPRAAAAASAAKAAAAAAPGAATAVWPLPLPPSAVERERLHRWVGRQPAAAAAAENEEKRLDAFGDEEAGAEEMEAGRPQLEDGKQIGARPESDATVARVGGEERSLPGMRGVPGMGARVVLARGAFRSASSPSAGCRSVHAMSAFSAASWCSSSYNGDVRSYNGDSYGDVRNFTGGSIGDARSYAGDSIGDARNFTGDSIGDARSYAGDGPHSAPTATVRSPASYFGGGGGNV